jgi:hypothetical protein
VIAIDNTLVDHAGQLIADVGWFWDHANERYVIAHDYLLSNYVCPSGAHYPIEWRRFRKQDACQQEEFQDHTALCIELINDAIARGIPGDFTFDSYVTSAKVLTRETACWESESSPPCPALCGCEAILSTGCSKTSEVSTNWMVMDGLSFRTRYAGSMAPCVSCAKNGRFFEIKMQCCLAHKVRQC